MAKGQKTGGRSAGIPNKATQEAREAIAEFINGNAHRLQDWLDRVAIQDPEKAFSLFQSVIEYHVPKLARTTTVGDPDAPLEHKVRVEIIASNHTDS